MQSKAHIKSHPIHPIMVVFPIAFYFGTVIFDSLAILQNNLQFSVTGKYMHIAGIVGAVLAAIPGVIDFIYTVPPKSSAKKRAAKHGIINSSVLMLFVAALIIKNSFSISPYLILVIEILGLGLTMVAGWMGGTLVHRNQISVVNRYANSGKWKEVYLTERSGHYEVATIDELKVNHMKLIHLGDKRIVVARTENGYVAFNDRCSHKGGSLAGGNMICGTVYCPWHGSLFDVKTGAVKAGPAKEAIETYAVNIREDKIYLVL